MKKFARGVLIIILVALLGAAGGYAYENLTIQPMYSSTTRLYVVPGDGNEATLRASDGGLKDDFAIIFKSSVVISDAQKTLGTSEDISKYLTVATPANSNIIEITCINADQNTAKNYVDAVAKTAIKTTSIIPVKSIQILSEGTATGESFKPDLIRNTAIIAGAAAAVCLVIELLVLLFRMAFHKKTPEEEAREQAAYQTPLLEMHGTDVQSGEDNELLAYMQKRHKMKEQEKNYQEDILAELDDDYASDEEEDAASQEEQTDEQQNPEEQQDPSASEKDDEAVRLAEAAMAAATAAMTEAAKKDVAGMTQQEETAAAPTEETVSEAAAETASVAEDKAAAMETASVAEDKVAAPAAEEKAAGEMAPAEQSDAEEILHAEPLQDVMSSSTEILGRIKK